MSSIIVFNDSFKADGFEKGVEKINSLLEKHELKVKLQFIEDFIGVNGEFAFNVSIVPDDLPESKNE
mgnify:CR=1 FL=1|jgi:hypothetical protein|tara:strand:- start:439 stop:639 length:201 start_codon:yes stop_codon:yes gene_type:complete